ncbi:MAG TPA: hypothetical protein VG672_25635, partial [Bryobacteraceae bacterium]|nr:hypothetical protein [Bryobacteraceae bacterium]
LALWVLGFPRVSNVTSRLLAQGRPLNSHPDTVEDYAEARLDLQTGAVVRLACSWKLPAGCDAQISGSFYGTKAGARFHNIGGSFYEFTAEHLLGTHRQVLSAGQEEWGGRAVVDWARRLGSGLRFDPEVENLGQVASVLDAIYREGGLERGRPRAGADQNRPELRESGAPTLVVNL